MVVLYILLAFFAGAMCWYFRADWEIRQLQKRRCQKTPDCQCFSCLTNGALRQPPKVLGKGLPNPPTPGIDRSSFSSPELKAIWAATQQCWRTHTGPFAADNEQNKPNKGRE